MLEIIKVKERKKEKKSNYYEFFKIVSFYKKHIYF